MDRRRFLVTSISTAAVATVLATDACSSGRGGLSGSPLFPSGNLRSLGSRVNVLNVRYATTNIAGYKLRGRTYNGKTVGPMFEVSGGDTLTMKIVNKLPPNPVSSPQLRGPVLVPVVHDSMEAMEPTPHGPFRPADNIDPMNNPHNFNTTNMHVHGIQTIPHLFEPLGTSNPAAEMIEVQPGQSYRYDFPIPLDHPSGLHWYHPHNHGSTDVQVSNGMAGLIVVRGPIDEVPEIKAAREIFMVVQTLDVNPSKKNKDLYEREYISFRSPQNGGYTFSTQFTMITLNGQGINWVDNRGKDKIYKQLPLPQFNVKPGEVVRIRLLNGTNYLPLFSGDPRVRCLADRIRRRQYLEADLHRYERQGRNRSHARKSIQFEEPLGDVGQPYRTAAAGAAEAGHLHDEVACERQNLLQAAGASHGEFCRKWQPGFDEHSEKAAGPDARVPGDPGQGYREQAHVQVRPRGAYRFADGIRLHH